MRYMEFSSFLRHEMERRDLNVRQIVAACGDHIAPRRFYDFLEGVRVPQGWEASLMSQRLGVSLPWRALRGEDRFGAQKKAFQSRQLHLPGLREIKK